MKEYAAIPAADLYGNAGSLGPGEREQRYRPYTQRLCLNRGAEEIIEEPGGCNGATQ